MVASHADITAQVKVMGEIYGNAKKVAVLLPACDGETFSQLQLLTETAGCILASQQEYEESRRDDEDEEEYLVELRQQFSARIAGWEESIHRWLYFRRAWTFQEWAMATEIVVTLEGHEDGTILTDVKSQIVIAVSVLSQWTMRCAQHQSPPTDRNNLPYLDSVRGEVGRRSNVVRRLFPYADFLVADDEDDQDSLRRRIILSPLSSDGGTGILMDLSLQSPAAFRERLSLVLNALNMSRREARFEADKVCCWASMCNITYAYDKNDSLAIALEKVIHALRKRGVRIHNFHPNPYDLNSDVDLSFLSYAAAHRQTNSANDAYLVGPPAFTGRVDTVTHLKITFAQPPMVEKTCSRNATSLQRLSGTNLNRLVKCSDKDAFIETFRELTCGTTTGTLTDVVEHIEICLESIPDVVLENYVLLLFTIDFKPSAMMIEQDFKVWAICRKSEYEYGNIHLARETLNGTFVVAGQYSSGAAKILAYPMMTHQRDGSFLVKANTIGIVDVVFVKTGLFDLEDLTSSLEKDMQMDMSSALQKDMMTLLSQSMSLPGLEFARDRLFDHSIQLTTNDINE
ncbi:hypothetical protein N0V83_008560 [Neocucurbitaria cava]|uniref:Heterokaryon incompatibility domain-containing protein n=1 Tax=Neocucurbitaria cava TaxID=798079 RepID=A0A9W8Y398_9PLEO|nr:hypothetical protein N0V83_008560 [Neocucurbitaria cava]